MIDTGHVIRQLEMVADLLTIEGTHPLLSHSYRRAAAKLRDNLPKTIDDSLFDEEVTRLPGIRRDLAAHVIALGHNQHPNLLDTLSQSFPPTLAALLMLPDLGPRRVYLLYAELGIDTLDKLEAAANEGKLRRLPRFGPSLEQRLLKTIQHRRKTLAERHGTEKLQLC